MSSDPEPSAKTTADAPARTMRGLVLAGGRSERMGSDKANLIHPDGRALARRCADLLAESGCVSVTLSLRHEQEVPEGFGELAGVEIARDPEGASVGPVAGMVAAMKGREDADWLVVACDLPRLDVGTLANLARSVRAGERFLSYRSEFDGLPEPLCALYSAGALPLLEEALENGMRCPRKILIRGECRLLDPVTPRALDNANTPGDWELAKQP